MTTIPKASDLIEALRSIEINASLAGQIDNAPRHAAFMTEALDGVLPALGQSYGIEPSLDYRRGRVHGRAAALRLALQQAKSVRSDFPVPRPLAKEIETLTMEARDLRRDTEAFTGSPATSR